MSLRGNEVLDCLAHHALENVQHVAEAEFAREDMQLSAMQRSPALPLARVHVATNCRHVRDGVPAVLEYGQWAPSRRRQVVDEQGVRVGIHMHPHALSLDVGAVPVQHEIEES